MSALETRGKSSLSISIGFPFHPDLNNLQIAHFPQIWTKYEFKHQAIAISQKAPVWLVQYKVNSSSNSTNSDAPCTDCGAEYINLGEDLRLGFSYVWVHLVCGVGRLSVHTYTQSHRKIHTHTHTHTHSHIENTHTHTHISKVVCITVQIWTL